MIGTKFNVDGTSVSSARDYDVMLAQSIFVGAGVVSGCLHFVHITLLYAL